MKSKNIKYPGLYMLFNSKLEIVYIGKSQTNLFERGFKSFRDKRGSTERTRKDVFYISFLKTPLTSADINIYEIYLIEKYKPLYNGESKTFGKPTIVLPEIYFTKLYRADCLYSEKFGLQIFTNFSDIKVPGVTYSRDYFNDINIILKTPLQKESVKQFSNITINELITDGYQEFNKLPSSIKKAISNELN